MKTFRFIIALAIGIIAALAGLNTASAQNAYREVIDPEKGELYLVFSGNVSPQLIADRYDHVYREAIAGKGKLAERQHLTWQMIYEANKRQSAIPVCLDDRGYAKRYGSPGTEESVWRDCDKPWMVFVPGQRVVIPTAPILTGEAAKAKINETIKCLAEGSTCTIDRIATIVGVKPAMAGDLGPKSHPKDGAGDDPSNGGTPDAGTGSGEQSDAGAGSGEQPDAGMGAGGGNSNEEKPKDPEKPSEGFTLTYSGIPLAFGLAIGLAMGRVRRRAKRSVEKPTEELDPRKIPTQKRLPPPSAQKFGLEESPWTAPVDGNGACLRGIGATLIREGSAKPEKPSLTLIEPDQMAEALGQTSVFDGKSRTRLLAQSTEAQHSKANGKGANGHSLPVQAEPMPLTEDTHAQCRHDLEEAEANGVANISRFREKALNKLAERDAAIATEQRAHAATRADLETAQANIAKLEPNLAAVVTRVNETMANLTNEQQAHAATHASRIEAETRKTELEMELSQKAAVVAAIEVELATGGRHGELIEEVRRIKGDSSKLRALHDAYSQAAKAQDEIHFVDGIAAVVNAFRAAAGPDEVGKDGSFERRLSARELARAHLVQCLAPVVNRDPDSIPSILRGLFREEEADAGSGAPPSDPVGEEHLARYTGSPTARVKRIDTQPLRHGEPEAIVPDSQLPSASALSAPLGSFPGVKDRLDAAQPSGPADDGSIPGRISKIPTLVPPPPPTVRNPPTN